MSRRGFSLVEVLVAAFVFSVVILGVAQSFSFAAKFIALSRIKTEATLIANEQFELARNLPYQQVGLIGGLPSGVLPRTQSSARGGALFNATTTIRNIDDAFDGTVGGTPHDTSPADYKQMSITIGCANCPLRTPLVFTTTLAPKSLETTSQNGALFINVVDASGLPVGQAVVRVINSQAEPPIDILEETNNNGQLQLVDVPPGTNAYEIVVTKAGYSQDRTYSITLDNPNPTQPHLTVATGQITAATFAIDRLSDLGLTVVEDSCAPVADLAFSLSSNKLISTLPLIYKYDESFTTNSAGQKAISDLEWGSYDFRLAGLTYDLVGIAPLPTISLPPASSEEATVFLTPHQPRSLQLAVTDAVIGAPLELATTTLSRGETTVGVELTNASGTCLPSGQALYSGLTSDIYAILVEREGYQTYTNSNYPVSANWQKLEVELQPN